MYTKHAMKRCQQRAIPEDLCNLVLEHGEFRYDHHGARVWFMTDKALKKLEKSIVDGLRKKLEKKKNIFVVESLDNNSIITAGYSYKASKSIGRGH